MLTKEEKIKIFEELLDEKEGNYSDYLKEEIYIYFFENESDFKFLDKLESKEKIKEKLYFIIGKMVLHEHEDGIENIIHYYT